MKNLVFVIIGSIMIICLIPNLAFKSYNIKKDGLLNSVLILDDGKYQLVRDKHNGVYSYTLYEVDNEMAFGIINSITMYYVNSNKIYVVGKESLNASDYSYFVLSFDDDSINKYFDLEDMPSQLQIIFNDKENFNVLA